MFWDWAWVASGYGDGRLHASRTDDPCRYVCDAAALAESLKSHQPRPRPLFTSLAELSTASPDLVAVLLGVRGPSMVHLHAGTETSYGLGHDSTHLSHFGTLALWRTWAGIGCARNGFCWPERLRIETTPAIQSDWSGQGG